MLRVGNLEKSITFYTQVLGMLLLRQVDNTECKYSLAFVGYAEAPEGSVIELTYNWGVDSYNNGNAYGHIAIEVDDLYAACDAIRNNGGEITREPGPVNGGVTEIAFITDPDGYAIELIASNAPAEQL